MRQQANRSITNVDDLIAEMDQIANEADRLAQRLRVLVETAHAITRARAAESAAAQSAAAQSAAARKVGQLITVRDLVGRLGISRHTVWRMVRDKRLPRPVQITSTRIAWREAEILAWMAAR